MCPVCIATAALIAGKATSTAGLTAIAVRKTWHRLQPVKHVAQPSTYSGRRGPSQVSETSRDSGKQTVAQPLGCGLATWN
jgi:hypothetical protein